MSQSAAAYTKIPPSIHQPTNKQVALFFPVFFVVGFSSPPRSPHSERIIIDIDIKRKETIGHAGCVSPMNRVLHPLSSITKHHNTIIITRKQELLLGRYNIRKFVSHIASPSASSFSNNNDNTSPRCYSRNTTPMKLQFSKWAVLLLSTSRYSSAWTQRNTPIYQSATSSSSSSFFMSKSAFSSMDDDSKIATLSLSVPPPEETTTMKKTMKMMMIPQEGNVVADGQIVSSFRGGLISVRVDDDFVEGFPTTTTNTPPSMMVSPASGKENPKSSLGTFCGGSCGGGNTNIVRGGYPLFCNCL